jgi:hypothetical protein
VAAEWVTGDVLQRQAEYWKRTLAGAPELLELPPTSAPARRTTRAPWAPGAGRGDGGAQALSRRHGTTLFMTLLARWAAVLAASPGRTRW